VKLSQIYSNDDKVFPRIRFNAELSVIFAQVKDPETTDVDSHNLGKSFLITVIDFALLGGIDKKHPFRVHDTVFGAFEFYIEIITNAGKYVTIRRPVRAERNSIFINTSDDTSDLLALDDDAWTYASLGLDAAKSCLDNLVSLTVVAPYGYRKGLGFMLRRQRDYDDEFRIVTKFGRSRDSQWKPYVALLLGFDHELLTAKYNVDARITELSALQKRLETRVGVQQERYDELRGALEVREHRVSILRRRLDAFSFGELEAEVAQTTLSNVEGRISELNEEVYHIEYDLRQIDKALEARLGFDLEEVQQLYAEVEVLFPDQLVRSYQDLLRFNEKLTAQRTDRLQLHSRQLRARSTAVEEELKTLNRQRQRSLSTLKERRTLDKYKRLQAELNSMEAEVSSLRTRLLQMDHVVAVAAEISELDAERGSLIQQIGAHIREANPTFKQLRLTFSDLVNAVLGIHAMVSVQQNQEGNLEFSVKTLDQTIAPSQTSAGDGTSYRKLLCACFDLAVLITHASKSFFRFVYHDGVFEGLDDRKKVRWLELVREACSEHELQYVLTVIDADLPRDPDDNKLMFSEEEIIRRLDDSGDDGRLFRRPAF